jgi:hypothetical protein
MPSLLRGRWVLDHLPHVQRQGVQGVPERHAVGDLQPLQWPRDGEGLMVQVVGHLAETIIELTPGEANHLTLLNPERYPEGWSTHD